MNRTLFGCGFKKKIDFNGKEFDVTSALPTKAKVEKKLETCHHCGESFSTQQYLNMRLHFKHKDPQKPQQNCSSIFLERYVVDETNVQDAYFSAGVEQGKMHHETSSMPFAKKSGQHGASQRKSYTLEFKMHALHLLDLRSGTTSH
eukprot:gene14736-16271_t